MKKSEKRKLIWLIVIIVLCIVFAPFVESILNSILDTILPEQEIHIYTVDDQPYTSQGELTIHFIDVGQADSILITLNDSSMLIDAGNNGDGDLVVEYLENEGIKKLNYIIGTHPHEDHIGGLDDVIDAFDSDIIIMPMVKTNSNTFESVLDSIDAKNESITYVEVGDTFDFDVASFTVLSVMNEPPEELNLCSVVIRLEYGNNSFLFTGDAETYNEKDMLKSGLTLKSDVLKVGHHGSDSSSSEAFIKAVSPKIGIISCGVDNKYGHPCQVTLDTLDKYHVSVYRTDILGTIILKSDGNTIKIKWED